MVCDKSIYARYVSLSDVCARFLLRFEREKEEVLNRTHAPVTCQRCALVPSCGAAGTAIPAPSMIWMASTITAATVSTDMAYCGR